MKAIINLYKGIRKFSSRVLATCYNPIAKLLFQLNGATYGSHLRVYGLIKVHVTRRGKLSIGNHCKINSGRRYNIIGRQQQSIFWVEGNLEIGDNVGLSAVALICNHKINIGNNVIIGGNTVVYDTDFHSLDPKDRAFGASDKLKATKAEVNIGDNVFIGAHSTILKGVSIGKNAIVGACSVVTKDIPENQIWAGNPAKFIKENS